MQFYILYLAPCTLHVRIKSGTFISMLDLIARSVPNWECYNYYINIPNLGKRYGCFHFNKNIVADYFIRQMPYASQMVNVDDLPSILSSCGRPSCERTFLC